MYGVLQAWHTCMAWASSTVTSSHQATSLLLFWWGARPNMRPGILRTAASPNGHLQVHHQTRGLWDCWDEGVQGPINRTFAFVAYHGECTTRHWVCKFQLYLM